MIYATYIGKNKEYRTEFKTFVAGEKEPITQKQYELLKHSSGFEFEGKGVDKKLEKAKQEAKKQKEKERDDLKKEKAAINKKTAKAKNAVKESKFNFQKIKDAQKRLKKLIGK